MNAGGERGEMSNVIEFSTPEGGRALLIRPDTT